jgi:transposase
LVDSEYIATLEATNAELVQRVQMLEDKMALLVELLQKQGVKKDSHNSHLPPSSDISSKNKSLRPKSDRATGGQKGHPGKTLEMSASPDTVIDLKSNFCGRCGSSLAGAEFVLQARRQVVEIPPIKPIIEEYRQYVCRCPGCEQNQVADFPVGVKAPIQYGSSVQALTAYLSVYQYVPYQRLKSMFAQVFNLHLSEGTLENMLTKGAAKAGFVYGHIKSEISASKAVGSDETGAKVNGQKWWIWVWQNILNTFLVASDNRGSKTLNEVWENGLPKATLGSDRWAAQLKFPAGGHQLCLAHLMRDTIYLKEKENHEFADKFKELLSKVFKSCRKSRERKKAFSTIEGEELEKQFNQALLILIDAEKYPESAKFQRAMIKHRNSLLPCIYDLEIAPDNNGSERAIRNIKVKQKISGQFKTGQQDFCVIRSVIDTLLKRKLDVLTTLNQIMKIQPE